MSAPQVNTAPRGRKTVGKQPKAPQVIVLILGWKIAGTSAGATGGILKCTPAVEAIAPQVDVQILGRVLQAHPQEPPEVYSNVLPPSVGETTGGIHPHAVRHNYLCPTGGKHPKSTAGR